MKPFLDEDAEPEKTNLAFDPVLKPGMGSVETRCTELPHATLAALELPVSPWAEDAHTGAGRCHLRGLCYRAGVDHFRAHHYLSVLTVFLGATCLGLESGLEFRDSADSARLGASTRTP